MASREEFVCFEHKETTRVIPRRVQPQEWAPGGNGCVRYAKAHTTVTSVSKQQIRKKREQYKRNGKCLRRQTRPSPWSGHCASHAFIEIAPAPQECAMLVSIKRVFKIQRKEEHPFLGQRPETDPSSRSSAGTRPCVHFDLELPGSRTAGQ